MTDATWPFPLPDLHGVAGEHYSALREGRIVVQRCTACGTKRWYPRPACHACWSFEADWADVPTQGVVHSWTRIHHPFSPASTDDVPYQIVIVEVEDGIRVLGRMPLEYQDELKVGTAVRAEFIEVAPEATLLFFVPADGHQHSLSNTNAHANLCNVPIALTGTNTKKWNRR